MSEETKALESMIGEEYNEIREMAARFADSERG